MADSEEVPLGANHPTLGPFVRYGWGGPVITHIALGTYVGSVLAAKGLV